MRKEKLIRILVTGYRSIFLVCGADIGHLRHLIEEIVRGVEGVLGASTGYAAFDSVNPAVYQAPFRFTGEIKQVIIDVSGKVIKDDETELKRLMTQQ